MFKGFL